MINLYKALACFQQEVLPIHKGTAGYGYSYSDLPAIFQVINPLLTKHGLGFTQLIQGTQMETIIFHCESGESLTSISDIPMNVQLKGMNDFQVMGSAITYFRRYTLSSALGLVTDKDTDVGGEQTGKRKEEVQKKQPLNSERFEKALKAIAEGKVTRDSLIDGYALTDEQLLKL